MPGQAWVGGSTRAWRKTRAKVLERDGWVCQLCGEPIPRHLRPPHPRSATVHHLVGKAYGDDPSQLVAAHRACNGKIGDPSTSATDPEPRPWL